MDKSERKSALLSALHVIGAALHIATAFFIISMYDKDAINVVTFDYCPAMRPLREALHITDTSRCVDEVGANFNPMIILCLISVFTGISHLVQVHGVAHVGSSWLVDLINKHGVNPVRWIEYATTLTLMGLVLLTTVGIGNISAIVMASSASVAWIPAGYLLEMSSVQESQVFDMIHTRIFLGVTCTISFILYTVATIDGFSRSFSRALDALPKDNKPPDGVWAMAAILPLMYTLFLVTNGLFAYVKNLRNRLWMREYVYAALSITSKMLLAWLFLFAVVGQMSQEDGADDDA
jgi:hypothetical protein